MIHLRIQKRLIKLAIALAVIVTIFGVMDYFLSSQIDSANEELTRINGQVVTLKGRLVEITNEQKKRVDAQEFYNDYKDSPSARPENFNRDKARSFIARMRQQFGLNGLQASNLSFRELRTAQETERSIIVKTSASIRFSSAYDMPVYDFIAAMDDQLPGQIVINNVSIKRLSEPDAVAIADITRGVERNLVQGEISFDWYGIVDPTMRQKPEAISPADLMPETDISNIFDAMQDVENEKKQAEKDLEPKPVTVPVEQLIEKSKDAKTAPVAPTPAAPAKTAPAPAAAPKQLQTPKLMLPPQTGTTPAKPASPAPTAAPAPKKLQDAAPAKSASTGGGNAQ